MEILDRDYVAGKPLKPGEVLAVLNAREHDLLSLVQEIRHGRIERLNVKDGQPFIAECLVTKMVKFGEKN